MLFYQNNFIKKDIHDKNAKNCYDCHIKQLYTLFQNGRHLSILLFPCKLALMALFKVKYSIEFEVESEAKRANLHGNKRILKWWPFWNTVY